MLDDWLAYYAVEPWKEQRADLRAGLQSAHFHATMTGEKLPIDHFLPDWEAQIKKKESEDLDAWAKAMGAVEDD